MKRRGFFAWAAGGLAVMLGMRKAPAAERDRTADFQMAIDLAKEVERKGIAVQVKMDPEDGFTLSPFWTDGAAGRGPCKPKPLFVRFCDRMESRDRPAVFHTGRGFLCIDLRHIDSGELTYHGVRVRLDRISPPPVAPENALWIGDGESRPA